MKTGNPLLVSHNLEILTIIRDNPGIKKSDLYSMLEGSRNTRQERTDELIDLGLIEEKQQGRYNVKALYITQKGIDALKTMEDLNKILSNETKQEESEKDFVESHRRSVPNTLADEKQDQS
ncbi:hypothetical protein [Candidatus Methanomassiliicoccus intestinalis]|uniref:HTH hxlR-type domain-containing protein n=1 Tax=Methanomassiliicoccus intestinalis (strain Issoire-Mx1) TaxID=1295009 RepID=R9TBN8_METII|nr:hypothetical protein [Candidatus Methanomassiliicoccus intestinalis]AGN27111.1 hypothetical protein MMINT_18320 [Candidatus Methanomassiliicoccus intestinalis Issoire-Mx1]